MFPNPTIKIKGNNGSIPCKKATTGVIQAITKPLFKPYRQVATNKQMVTKVPIKNILIPMGSGKNKRKLWLNKASPNKRAVPVKLRTFIKIKRPRPMPDHLQAFYCKLSIA